MLGAKVYYQNIAQSITNFLRACLITIVHSATIFSLIIHMM